MKTYVIEFDILPTDFYPTLNQEQTAKLYARHLFQPLKVHAQEWRSELVIKEELDLIGQAIIQASDKVAKKLRQLGFHLQVKKTK